MSDLGNKKVMSDNIQYYLNKNGITRKKLSADLDISYSTLSSWLQADSYPRIDKIEMMANYFGVSKADLVENHEKEIVTNYFSKKPRMIPLIGTIAMGVPITAEQNIEKYIPEYMMDKYADDPLFALRCKGDSMYPLIPNGAIATIKQQPDVEDGEIAAVLINGEATLKKILHVGKTVVLRPANPEYKDIILDKDHPGTILGKMIKYEVNFD